MTDTAVLKNILEHAGLKSKHEQSGVTYYETKKKPIDFRPAFVRWERVK